MFGTGACNKVTVLPDEDRTSKGSGGKIRSPTRIKRPPAARPRRSMLASLARWTFKVLLWCDLFKWTIGVWNHTGSFIWKNKHLSNCGFKKRSPHGLLEQERESSPWKRTFQNYLPPSASALHRTTEQVVHSELPGRLFAMGASHGRFKQVSLLLPRFWIIIIITVHQLCKLPEHYAYFSRKN